MPTAVACPKCKTKYSLPDNLLGKPVKCKSCGSMFKVNTPVATVATSESTRRQMPASHGNAEELAKLGLDGPILNQPELFGALPNPKSGNPLGNHVVVDPGFADTETFEPEDVDPDDISSMFHNPALGPPPKKQKVDADLPGNQKRKRKKKQSDKGEQIWLIVLTINLIALIATVLMGLMMDITTATKAYFYGVNSLLAIVGMAVGIWWLVRCFQCKDSVGQFLMVFIPFYIFYFSFKPDKSLYTRAPMNAWFAMAAGGVALAIAAYFLGFNAEFNRLLIQIQ